MRLHLVWLGAFCGSANVNSLATELTPSPATWPDPLTTSKDDVSIPRSLKAIEDDEGKSVISTADKGERSFISTAEKDDEERVSFNSLPDLQEMWSRLGEPVQKTKSRVIDHFESTITEQTWARWEKTQESPKYVLNRLVRAKAGVTDFNRWLGHANSLELDNEAILSMLVRYYPAGDLYELLGAAKNELSLKALAEELQRLQIQGWLARNDNPDVIFKVLKLSDRKLDDVMTSPNLPVWDNYFDQFKTKNHRSLITRVRVLQDLCNDDKAVFQKLVMTKTEDSVAGKLAEKWLGEQMDSWLKVGYRPRDVFRVVERGCRLENVLTSPNLSLWTKYLDAFNEKPGVDKTCAADVLLDTYLRDEAVFWMLEKAKKKPLTSALATEWQKQQIQNWSKKPSLLNSEEVFRVLGLNRKLDGLLKHSFMKIWLNYMEETGQSQGTEMIDTISKCFPPSMLNENLEVAKYDIDTKELAMKLQTQQMMKWINKERDPNYVFKKLLLDGDSKSTSNLKVWKIYVASYIKADPRGATQLMRRYSKGFDLSDVLPAA